MSAARKSPFRKRFLKTGLTVLCSAFIGGSFAAEIFRRRAQSNSLALNLMGLPSSHRSLITSFENLESNDLTFDTYLNSAESLLPYVRKLKPNISSHHILRIEAASFLQKYHNVLSQILNERNKNNKNNKNIDFDEYSLHLRRRVFDMKLAFDFLNFKPSEVTSTITNIIKFNKMDYARCSRDGKRIRMAFDEIYNNMNNKDNISKTDNNDDDDDEKKENKLLEHELMALYTHAPYLGEWHIFMKIGNALNTNYGKLQPMNNNINIYGHNDGINFNDLYYIAKNNDIVNKIPIPMQSNLKFNTKPIESIKIKYNSFKWINQNNEENKSWFAINNKKRDIPSISSIEKNKWIELNNNNYNDNIIPLTLCRLGGVQKSISISKCVPRVQGPIFYDNTIKMRGSATFMEPTKNTDFNKNDQDNKIETIIPNNIPLNGINDFIQIRQIEEWDLKPVEVGNTDEFEGKVIIRREPVNNDNNDKCDSFEVEYDCILKLSSKVEEYY